MAYDDSFIDDDDDSFDDNYDDFDVSFDDGPLRYSWKDIGETDCEDLFKAFEQQNAYVVNKIINKHGLRESQPSPMLGRVGRLGLGLWRECRRS